MLMAVVPQKFIKLIQNMIEIFRAKDKHNKSAACLRQVIQALNMRRAGAPPNLL